MTIRDIKEFIDSLPDWAILDGCFGGTSIKPMDIDGCVERKGIVLFLEHKRPSALLKEGHVRTFRALARQGNMVLIFWGDLPEVTRIRILEGEESKMIENAALDDLRRIVSEWFEKTNKP
jgi:hypothetical protein